MTREKIFRTGFYAGVALYAMLVVATLAACGGGETAAVVSAVGTGGSIAACKADCTDPSTPARTCAGQGYQGTFPACMCPLSYQTYTGADLNSNTAGTCTGNPPPPTCRAGQSLTGYGAQCCPTGDTGDGIACYAPAPPPTCTSGTTGTYPNCVPIQCNAVVGGYWGGPAAGCVCPATYTGTYPACLPPACPAGDTGTPPDCVAPPTCNDVSGAYWGGAACECPAGDVGTYPACIAQSSLSITLNANLDPTTVTDDSLGVGAGTESTLSWSVSSNVAGDAFTCTVNGGSLAVSPVSVGPFAPSQDGSTVAFTVACKDAWGAQTSQSVSLTVVPPPQAPPDQFTCVTNADASVTCRWVAYEPGAECYVERTNGDVLTGQSGGSSGNVSTGVLFQPDLFQLYCPNTGTTASPNPVPAGP